MLIAPNPYSGVHCIKSQPAKLAHKHKELIDFTMDLLPGDEDTVGFGLQGRSAMGGIPGKSG